MSKNKEKKRICSLSNISNRSVYFKCGAKVKSDNDFDLHRLVNEHMEECNKSVKFITLEDAFKGGCHK